MDKIESLTAAQERSLIAYREECLRIGRCCEPADRPEAERVFAEMYACLSKPKPTVFWFDGPATGSMFRTRANLLANLGANLGANLRARDNLWDNLRANLRANLGDNLRASIRANLGANLWDNLRDNLSWKFWGEHESAWPAFYAWPHVYLRPMHSVEQQTKLNWWLDLSKSVGWWEPYEGIVFACERPLKQSVDERGRLHCDNGPAIVCRDGWMVYAIHNVRVPEYIVERPHEITAEKIKAERNAEVRRVMVQRFGFDRYVTEIGAKLVSTDSIGKLWRVEDEAPFHLAEVINSTPEPDGTVKTYFLPMPDQNDLTGKPLKNCREAIAWSFGLHEKEYRPSVQT